MIMIYIGKYQLKQNVDLNPTHDVEELLYQC